MRVSNCVAHFHSSTTFVQSARLIAKFEFRKAITSINYYIIAEKSDDRLDKQRVRIDPQRKICKEHYKGITVNTFVGPRISHAELVEV